MNQNKKFAVNEIIDEVNRVESEEGYSPKHDNGHVMSQLSIASAYYALPDSLRAEVDRALTHDNAGRSITLWPFEPQSFKPNAYRIRELVKAGQFIVAEIARLWSIRHDHIENVLPIADGSNMAEFKASFTAAMLADNLPQRDVDAIDELGWQEAFGTGLGAIDAYKDFYYEQ